MENLQEIKLHPINLILQRLNDNKNIQNFSPKNRRHFSKQKTKKFLPQIKDQNNKNKKFDPRLFDTKIKMAHFIYYHYGEGHYNICFYSKKKNRFGVSPVKRGEIIIHSNHDVNGDIDPDNCTFEWITHDKDGHRVDEMYRLRSWWMEDD